MIAVFGSGFGLYGHVPALVELGKDVCIPARYRAVFEERSELSDYRSAVRFAEVQSADELALLARSDVAVLVRRPADNEGLARTAMSQGHPRHLVIEKPPAATPEAAIRLDLDLHAAGIRYQTPYLFAHCDWARDCKARVVASPASDIQIKWSFRAASPGNSWKSSLPDGGGLLSYYFIHIIALAHFLLGNFEVQDSRVWRTEEESGILMTAGNKDQGLLATFCTGNSESGFSLSLNGATVFSAPTPFGAVPRKGERDPRINALKNFYTSEVFGNSSGGQVAWGSRTLQVWARLASDLHPARPGEATASPTNQLDGEAR